MLAWYTYTTHTPSHITHACIQDSLVDKLRLKNATLKARRVKLQTQLKQVHIVVM